MYTKKFLFSACTVPGLLYFNLASEFQRRRKADKEVEAKRRLEAMSAEPVDITPKNGGTLPWAGKEVAEFEKEWNCKPV